MRHVWMVLLVLTFATTCFSQEYFLQPKISVGGSAGFFRISYDNYSSLYSSRWSEPYGGYISIKIPVGGFSLLGKYKQFEKDGKSVASGTNMTRANWQESWYNIGIRTYSGSFRRTSSFYGFGVAFFNIKENAQAALLLNPEDSNESKSGNGFFLEAGVQRRFNRRMSMFFEFEATSGGIGGKTVLEGQSIGGLFFGLGISLNLIY